MGRRSDHSREELLELSVEAARDLVETSGMSSLTARNVAGRIGYSPGTLYNMFANFDELILRVNASTLDAMYEHMSAIRFAGDPIKDLLKLADSYIKFVDWNNNLWTMVIEHQSSSDGPLPEWFHQRVNQLLGVIEQALAPLFNSNATSKRREAARVLWSAFHGIWSLAGNGKLDVITDRSVKDMTQSLVINYVTGLGVSLERDASHV